MSATLVASSRLRFSIWDDIVLGLATITGNLSCDARTFLGGGTMRKVAPLARPTFTDSRGNTATWILSMSDQVASEQLQAVPHLGQLNLALSHLGVWQPGTSCDPHHRSLQKPARSPSQLGHDVTAGTVMSAFYLLQMADEFSSCFEAALIEKVEQFPWLWDTSGHDYRDKIKRENSWKTIGNLLKRSADECKRAWQAIRGRYGREARICMGRSGAGRDDIRQPSWTLWNLLSFLKHQIHPRASKKPQMALEQANLVVAPEASGGLSPVTPTDPDECPEATDKEIPDTDTSDSLQDDLQLSSTCQLLLQLEQNNHMPSSSQLVPPQCAPSGAHPTLLSPPRPALVERQPQTPQPVPLRSRKRTHKGTSPQGRAQEDAALATVIEESVRQMGRVCTRPHLI
ncbi:uncharacterized protein LOC115319187 isoform X3 [Ixodes scapularis]|uniref:uncharacterized protein LOC115319187 isoform X3 n=1 Tax=Ixodes scapularis TaxID=6945 RepID=UPI001C37EF39|nr:uncharacterized protein LOC115319187 isoform X3 [Ixodes scapularis]